MSDTTLSSALRHTLPEDAAQACLVGRIWQPGVGPVLVAVAGTSLLDLSSLAPTSSQLLALPDPAAAVLAAMQTGRLPVWRSWMPCWPTATNPGATPAGPGCCRPATCRRSRPAA